MRPGQSMMRVKTLARLAVVSVCLAILSCANEEKFAVLDSEPVTLLADDRTIFINYWAVWCGPCIEEMPVLAEFREQNSDKVEVYGVNFDNPTPEQLRSDIEKLNVQIPNLLEDPAPAFGVITPQILPSTLVVRKGKLIDVLIGLQTLESLAAAL